MKYIAIETQNSLKRLNRLNKHSFKKKKNSKLEDQFKKHRQNVKWSDKDVEYMKERLKDTEVISASSQDGVTGTRLTLPTETVF